MNRLEAELQRLYRPDGPGLVSHDGRVRALVLELARPGSWEALAKAWRGVQVDLELPAPSIAVSGIDGLQLWFSLAESVPVAQAMVFLDLLRRRYLGDIRQERIGMQPSVDASMPGAVQHAHAVLPPVERATGRWSAFVAPDLASLFADEPWLDLPPGLDAQADLLSRLESTKPDDWKRALERLGPANAPVSAPASPAAAASGTVPRQFLLGVMNDPAIELHLRIEAAKALLPYFEGNR